MQSAIWFDTEKKLYYKAILDKDRNFFSISGWPICKKIDRKKNKRQFYYRASDLSDLLSMMLYFAPFKKPKIYKKDDGLTLKAIRKNPWIWK